MLLSHCHDVAQSLSWCSSAVVMMLLIFITMLLSRCHDVAYIHHGITQSLSWCCSAVAMASLRHHHGTTQALIMSPLSRHHDITQASSVAIMASTSMESPSTSMTSHHGITVESLSRRCGVAQPSLWSRSAVNMESLSITFVGSDNNNNNNTTTMLLLLFFGSTYQ